MCVVYCMLCVVCCVVCYVLCFMYYLLFVICYLLCVVCCVLFIVCCVVCCVLCCVLCVIWAVFFLLSGSVYSCAAYTIVYAVPTRPQWEPTRLIPLKVYLRRPNARKSDTTMYVFAYAVTLLFAFGRLETELLPTRPQSHSHFCSTSAQAPKRP